MTRRHISNAVLILLLSLLPMSAVLAGGAATGAGGCAVSAAETAELLELLRPPQAWSQATVTLTQENVLETSESVLSGDLLSDEQTVIIESYSAYLDDGLSEQSQGVLAQFQAEAEALGIQPHEIDEAFSKMETPKKDPRWALFTVEAEALFSALPGDSDNAKALPAAIGIALAIIGCEASTLACLGDVLDIALDCIEGRLCDDQHTVDTDCCRRKKTSDDRNCALTCGANGHDGDYALCCE